MDELVLQLPRQRRFGILLDVARHHRIPPSAHGDVQRRTRTTGIGETGCEADLLDEALGIERGLDLPRRFAPPAVVAELFDIGGNLVPSSHRRCSSILKWD